MPLRNAYMHVGQRASVRVNSGVAYEVAPAAPPFPQVGASRAAPPRRRRRAWRRWPWLQPHFSHRVLSCRQAPAVASLPCVASVWPAACRCRTLSAASSKCLGSIPSPRCRRSTARHCCGCAVTSWRERSRQAERLLLAGIAARGCLALHAPSAPAAGQPATFQLGSAAAVAGQVSRRVPFWFHRQACC